MPGGVGEQVAQHLDDAQSIRHDPGQVRRQVDVKVVPAPAAQERVPGLVHQDGYVHGSGSYRQVARLDVRHVEQIAYQLAHPVGLRVDDPVELERLGGVQRGGGVQQGGDGAFDRGQRGAQLVAHHAQELGAQPLQLFQRRHVL